MERRSDGKDKERYFWVNLSWALFGLELNEDTGAAELESWQTLIQ